MALIFSGVLSCGGGGEEAPVTPTAPPAATTPPAVENTVGFGQAETTQDVPFSLNMEQPVPPAFREAYQRRALISVQFYKATEDPFYPQGLGPDEKVRTSVNTSMRLRRAASGSVSTPLMRSGFSQIFAGARSAG